MPSFRHWRAARTVVVVAITAMVTMPGGFTATPLVAQSAGTPASTGASNFTIFLRTSPIGSESVKVERSSEGWTITSSGRADIPIDSVTRRLQLRYTVDWKPIDFTIDATLRGQSLQAFTKVEGATATNVVTQSGQTTERSDPIAPDAIILPVSMWGPFEALAQRLRTAPAGSTIPAYALGSSYPVLVGASTEETLQTSTRTIRARRTIVTLSPAGSVPLATEVWADEGGRLMRISIPSQNLEIVRDDVSSVAVRRVLVSRPGDQEVRFPANGFRLAGTVSHPSGAARESPLVVLVGGAGPTDRDENLYGVPVFGQLAGVLADAGFTVVRYDKRGVGQSGGRAESATIVDFADDLLAVVAGARKLPGIDRKRVAVAGHGDGGAVAMNAAGRQGDITALVLFEMMGTNGADLNLWRVNRSLEQSTRTPEEKAATVELQRRIHSAVVSGTGWDTIAPLYRQVDTPWFRSFLTFEPAQAMNKIAQPLLIVHGQLDTEVPPSSADALEGFARARKKGTVDVLRIPGVNHQLAAAVTGETAEYAALDKQVSPGVGTAVAQWLTRTFAAIR